VTANVQSARSSTRRRRDANRRRLIALFVRELGREREHPELCQLRLELMVGAAFQAIAAAIDDAAVAELPALAPTLESRAFVFA